MYNNIMGYNQQKAVEYGIDLTDLMILKWFQGFKHKDDITIDGITYHWINYKTLLDDLPVLKITSKRGLYKRLRQLVDKKILLHTCIKTGGTYSYYAFGPKYQELLSKQTKKHNSKQTEKKTDTYTQNSNEKASCLNRNQQTIETYTQLKLTATEAKIVSKWQDMDKLNRSIKIFNEKGGKLFAYLKGIYDRGAVEFQQGQAEIAVTTDDTVIEVENVEMVVGTEKVTQLRLTNSEDITQEMLLHIKQEQVISTVAYSTWFTGCKFRRLGSKLIIVCQSKSCQNIMQERYLGVLSHIFDEITKT